MGQVSESSSTCPPVHLRSHGVRRLLISSQRVEPDQPRTALPAATNARLNSGGEARQDPDGRMPIIRERRQRHFGLRAFLYNGVLFYKVQAVMSLAFPRD